MATCTSSDLESCVESIPPSHLDSPIPPWTETAVEFLVMERFPQLRRRLEVGPDAFGHDERTELKALVERRREEMRGVACPALHGKVSLLAGGDISHVGCDAIVNAANCMLAPGKGVTGAIHLGAGRSLLEECQLLGGCGVGEARITAGYNLPARHVVHTVGPEGNHPDRAALLRSCYLASLSLCMERGLHTIAFSCISTGAYHYPSLEAADIATATVREWLLTRDNLDRVDRVVFVTRTARDEEAYELLMSVYFPIDAPVS